MTQINVNDSNTPEVVETVPTRTTAPADTGTGHAVAAGINLITVMVVLAVALVIVWLIFQMVMPMVGR